MTGQEPIGGLGLQDHVADRVHDDRLQLHGYSGPLTQDRPTLSLLSLDLGAQLATTQGLRLQVAGPQRASDVHEAMTAPTLNTNPLAVGDVKASSRGRISATTRPTAPRAQGA